MISLFMKEQIIPKAAAHTNDRLDAVHAESDNTLELPGDTYVWTGKSSSALISIAEQWGESCQRPEPTGIDLWSRSPLK